MDVLKIILKSREKILALQNAIFTVFEFSETLVNLRVYWKIFVLREW